MRFLRLLTYFCMACSLFLWVPDIQLTVELRVGFLYTAGLGALGFLATGGLKHTLDRKYLALVGGFVVASSLALLVHPPLRDALVGRPLLHPGMLSLWASVACGFFWLQEQSKKQVLVVAYGLVCLWGLLNLLLQSSSERLGALGVQVHYASFLWLVGIVIGWWLFGEFTARRRLILGCQIFLTCCVILSGTRLTIALALLVSLIYAVFAHRNKRMLLVGAAVGLGASIALVTFTSNRVANSSYLGESISFRKSLVVAAVSSSLPDLMLGGGVGAIETAISQNSDSSPLLAASFAEGWIFESSHNYVVDTMVERGIIATLLLLIIIVLAFRSVYQQRSRESFMGAGVLLVTVLYVLGNNINVQVELILWLAIVPLLGLNLASKTQTPGNHKHKQVH